MTAFFLLTITLPALSILLPIDSPEIENRRISPIEVSVNRLLKPEFYVEVLEYTRDANPVQAWMMAVGTGLDYNLFGDSPNPSAVLLGKNGWLYGRESIGGLCQPGSPSTSVQNLLEVVALLRRSGAVVVFTVAPAKLGIHSEHLTEVQGELGQCAHRASEHLRRKLSDAADPGYIDSWTLFETMKSTGTSPYFRTDTHFNHMASITFIQGIVTRIQSDIWQDSSVHSRGENSFVGNLMTLIGLREVESSNEVVVERGFCRPPSEQLHDQFSDSQTATERFLAVASESRPLIDAFPRRHLLSTSRFDVHRLEEPRISPLLHRAGADRRRRHHPKRQNVHFCVASVIQACLIYKGRSRVVNRTEEVGQSDRGADQATQGTTSGQARSRLNEVSRLLYVCVDTQGSATFMSRLNGHCKRELRCMGETAIAA